MRHDRDVVLRLNQLYVVTKNVSRTQFLYDTLPIKPYMLLPPAKSDGI